MQLVQFKNTSDVRREIKKIQIKLIQNSCKYVNNSFLCLKMFINHNESKGTCVDWQWSEETFQRGL